MHACMYVRHKYERCNVIFCTALAMRLFDLLSLHHDRIYVNDKSLLPMMCNSVFVIQLKMEPVMQLKLMAAARDDPDEVNMSGKIESGDKIVCYACMQHDAIIVTLRRNIF